MALKAFSGLCIALSLAVVGCKQPGPQGGARLKTMPVQGIVHVDGEPAKGVTVTFHVEPGKSKMENNSITVTDENGAFFASTYVDKDGLPEGEYRLLFKWPQIQIGDKRPDKLKGAYNNPQTSEVKLTVEDGTPVDLGVIELFTKAKSKSAVKGG